MIDIFVATNASEDIFVNEFFFSLFLLLLGSINYSRIFLKTNTTTQRVDTVEINDTIFSTAVPY